MSSTGEAFDYLLTGIPTRAVNNLVSTLFEFDHRDQCLRLRPEFLDDDGRPMRISGGAMRSMVKRAVER